MTVRIRGIYTTALTNRLSAVVQPSPAIAERFERSFDQAPAAATVETTRDRQGVTVAGDPERVEGIVESLEALGIDTLSWALPLPQDGVFAGEVVEELGSGALVDVGPGEGFLPYGATSRRIETGDTLRVQVSEPRAPWLDGRPVLDTDVRIRGSLVSLNRGGTGVAGGTGGGDDGTGGGGPGGASTGGVGTGGPVIGDLIDAEPPEGWAPHWEREDEDVPFDALAAALDRAGDLATALDAALADAAPPAEAAPGPYWTGLATTACWFGRESRFALDAERRVVTDTMVGHHRIKAATDAASAAVDLVEAVCGGPGTAAGGDGASDGGPDADPDEEPNEEPNDGESDSVADPDGDPEGAFPFDAVASQFGPRAGDRIGIGHGKPDGRCISLGSGEVAERRADGTVVVEREMSPGGSYDALGVQRQAGDVATTKFSEGRWWYPTVYRGEDGERRGTYVNVCTPVEIFPDTVRYVDLHVDVVKHADGTVERVDDDELDDAVAAGEVPAALAKKARAVATAVERAL